MKVFTEKLFNKKRVLRQKSFLNLFFNTLALALLFFHIFSLTATAEGAKKNNVNKAEKTSNISTDSFFSGLNKFIIGDRVKSSNEFFEFKKLLEGKGYRNSSELSINLLEKARSEKLNGDVLGAKFLQDWAIKLSPSDARVSLLSFSSIISGLNSFLHSPSLFSVLLINGLQLAAISLMLALFITLVVQIGKNSETLIDYSFSLLPLNYRGFLGPLVTAFLLVVPLYFGLAISLACWAVILGYCFRNCKYLPLFTAFVFFFWVFPLQYAKKYVFLNNEPVYLAIESVNNGNFNYRDKEVLEKALSEESSSAIYSYFYGQSLAREGDLKKAEVYFKSVLNSTDKSSPIYKNALINSGALSLVQKNFKDSEKKLEEAISLGEKSFEGYYNLSQAKMALLDTISHGKNYQLAKKYNASLLEWSEANGLASDVPLFKPMNIFELNKTIFNSESFLKLQANQNIVLEVEDKLYSALLPVKNPKQGVLVLASFLFLIGVFIVTRKVKDKVSDDNPFFGDRISFVWHILPSGGLIVGKRPVLGAFFLSSIIACMMMIFNKPISLLSISLLPMNYEKLVLFFAFFLFLLAILFSYFLKNEGTQSLKVKNASR